MSLYNGEASVVCPSVRPSVCKLLRKSQMANVRIATKLAHDDLQVSLHPGCAVLKVKVKGHVIRTLYWILGMSYSVIDGLVTIVVKPLGSTARTNRLPCRTALCNRTVAQQLWVSYCRGCPDTPENSSWGCPTPRKRLKGDIRPTSQLSDVGISRFRQCTNDA